MQEKSLQNAVFFINRLKSVLQIRTDVDLADYLGIDQSTISAWKARNSINYELIFTKCKDVDFNWLIRGDAESLPGVKKIPRLKGRMATTGVPYYDNHPASAGDFESFLNTEKPTSFVDLPQIRDCLAILPVFGSSMKGVVEPGDLIAIKEIEGRSEFDPVLPHLVITTENRMIKYLHIDESDNNIVWAVSTNHPRIRLNVENIKKVYAIKGVIKIF